MKKLFLIIFLITAAMVSYADDQIIDLDGKSIILHDDFTWSYVNKGKAKLSKEIVLNFDPLNTTVLTSKNEKFAININLIQWVQTTGINESADFQFVNADETGYGVLIFDGLPVPLESLKDILIMNANSIDPNARIIDVTSCTVNNSNGELVTYVASYSGLEFIFYTYITTNDNGTIQFTFYTLSTKFEELKPSFQEAISGLEFY